MFFFFFFMFKEVNNEEELEKRLGDVWFDGRKMKIKRAHFCMDEKVQIMSNLWRKEVLVERSFKNVANVEFPTVEVTVCEGVLENLENSYVGVLPFHRDFKVVRTSFFMEGTNFIIIEIGDNMVMLICSKKGEIKRAQTTSKKWWEPNFKDIIKWSS